MGAATALERTSLGLLAGLPVGPLIAAGSRIVMRVLALAGHRELQFTPCGSLEILGTWTLTACSHCAF